MKKPDQVMEIPEAHDVAGTLRGAAQHAWLGATTRRTRNGSGSESSLELDAYANSGAMAQHTSHKVCASFPPTRMHSRGAGQATASGASSPLSPTDKRVGRLGDCGLNDSAIPLCVSVTQYCSEAHAT